MGVYVDAPIYPFIGRSGRKMMMCHMVADTLAELHDMAEKLGVRAHFQAHTRYPHYDICKSKRTQALSLGAMSCPDRKTLITKARALLAEIRLSDERKDAPFHEAYPPQKEVAASTPGQSLPASPHRQCAPVQIELPYSQD